MHTTTQPHIDMHEMRKMEEGLGALFMRRLMEKSAEQGTDKIAMESLPFNCLTKEEEEWAMPMAEKLFDAHLQALQRAKEEERLDDLAEQQMNGEDLPPYMW